MRNGFDAGELFLPSPGCRISTLSFATFRPISRPPTLVSSALVRFVKATMTESTLRRSSLPHTRASISVVNGAVTCADICCSTTCSSLKASSWTIPARSELQCICYDVSVEIAVNPPPVQPLSGKGRAGGGEKEEEEGGARLAHRVWSRRNLLPFAVEPAGSLDCLRRSEERRGPPELTEIFLKPRAFGGDSVVRLEDIARSLG